MKYLHYNKSSKKMFDISDKENIKYFDNIKIDEEQKCEILKKIRGNLDCYIDEINKNFYFKETFNPIKARADIVSFRDKKLKELDPFQTEHYQSYISLKKNIVIDEKYFNQITEYYNSLLDLPNAFDLSTDKENFIYIFVDELDEFSNTDENVYEILIPDFM